MATTISFVVGKGSITHNNRAFVAENVVEERIGLDKFYKTETLNEAYEKLFGTAVAEYNAKQKRNDRKIHDYISKIKNSKNNEKVFYENVVQIGKMTDYGVVDENGNITEAALKAQAVLEEYVMTFQERNPNLYLFNAVLHMDEATPHLHLDYIPVAHGYKTGMKTRNSLTKALQEMGMDKAVSRTDNETVHWQQRERDYITQLCREHGIEIEVLGVDRDNYTIPEYKEAMKAKNQAEADLELLKADKAEVIQFIEKANVRAVEVDEEVETRKRQLQEIDDKIVETQAQYQERVNVIDKLEEASDKVDKDLAEIKAEAREVQTLFSGEPTVKLSKKSYERLVNMAESAGTLKRMIKGYQNDISDRDKKIVKLKTMVDTLHKKVDMLEKFLEKYNLVEKFKDFLEPSTIRFIQEHRDRGNKRNTNEKKAYKKYDVERC